MTTKITTTDNGYFAVATRPCGHTARITTEYIQFSRKTDRKHYSQIVRNEIKKIDNRPCRKCEELTNS